MAQLEIIVLGTELTIQDASGTPQKVKAGTEAIKYWAGRDKKYGVWFDCMITGFRPFRLYSNKKHTHKTVEREPEEGLTILR